MGSPFVISLVAVVISIISLGWNVFQFVQTRRGRFKFFSDFGYVDPNSDLEELKIIFSIVNVGERKRIIKSIQQEFLVTPYELYKHDADDSISYPIALDPGEQFKYFTPSLGGERERMQFSIHENKTIVTSSKKFIKEQIRIILTDTTGREYVSHWVKLSQPKRRAIRQ